MADRRNRSGGKRYFLERWPALLNGGKELQEPPRETKAWRGSSGTLAGRDGPQGSKPCHRSSSEDH
jgi:hypothetical protein